MWQDKKHRLFVAILFLVNCVIHSREIIFDFDNPVLSNQDLMIQYSYMPNISNLFNPRTTTQIDKIFLSIQNNFGSISHYKIQLQEGEHRLFWHPSQIGTIVSARITIYNNFAKAHTQELVLGFKVLDDREQVQGYNVVPASLETILHWSNDNNKNYHDEFNIFRWQSYQDVLVFVFESRKVQEKYLKRLAFFTEKTKTRGTIPHLKDIANRKGWGANDFKAEDLARFFNMVEARKQSDDPMELLEEELLLQKILIDAETITHSKEDLLNPYRINTMYPYSSIVSYAKSDSPALQRTLLFHELLHTLYFRDEKLRNKVSSIWQSLSPKNQNLWRAFLAYNGYDSSYDYLVKNEFYAYLLQHSIPNLSWYIPARIIPETRKKLSTQETQQFIDSMISSARKLADYTSTHYKIYDGNVRYVEKIQ